MKTATVTLITGWRALLLWIAIIVAVITYWEIGKAIYAIYFAGSRRTGRIRSIQPTQ